MNKIKVYVYKNDFGHLLETFEKLTGNYAVGRTFIGERTITLDTPEVKEEKRREFFVNCVDSIEEFGLGRLRINAWSTPVRDNSNPHEMRFIHIKENEIIVSEDEAYIALSVFMCDPFIKKNNDYETYLETLGFKKDGV